MKYSYNPNLVGNAQELRKEMTPEEKHLWYDFLKKLPVNVYRQKNIENYIVDFYIASSKCIIELDGKQHNLKENQKQDEIRDSELNNLGIKVLRYKNESIRYNFNAVCKDILSHIGLSFDDLKR